MFTINYIVATWLKKRVKNVELIYNTMFIRQNVYHIKAPRNGLIVSFKVEILFKLFDCLRVSIDTRQLKDIFRTEQYLKECISCVGTCRLW